MIEGRSGRFLATGSMQPMALWRPPFRVAPETPNHTSHEVQRPSNAQGLGQQQVLSSYVQRTLVDRLPCTCHRNCRLQEAS